LLRAILSLLPQKNKLALTRIHQYQNHPEWPFQQVLLIDTFDKTTESPLNTFLMVPPSARTYRTGTH
jgi:hypothetical protein